MKKRFVSFGLAAVMAMSLTACGGGAAAGDAKTEAAKTEDSKAADGEEGKDGSSEAAGGVFKLGESAL